MPSAVPPAAPPAYPPTPLAPARKISNLQIPSPDAVLRTRPLVPFDRSAIRACAFDSVPIPQLQSQLIRVCAFDSLLSRSSSRSCRQSVPSPHSGRRRQPIWKRATQPCRRVAHLRASSARAPRELRASSTQPAQPHPSLPQPHPSLGSSHLLPRLPRPIRTLLA